MSLCYRRDHRDEATFAHDIREGTMAEHTLMKLLAEADPSMSYAEAGVDASGDVIDDDTSVADFQRPDYKEVTSLLLGLDGAHLEVKTHPRWHRMGTGHIKLGSIHGCVEHEAHLLMADMDGCLLFSPSAMGTLLREGVRVRRWAGGGGKPAMQYDVDKVDTWIERGVVTRLEWPGVIRERVRVLLDSLGQRMVRKV